MKLYARLGLSGLLLAAALILASCGGAGSGDMQGMDRDEKGKSAGSEMQGMNQDEKDKAGGMAGMDDENMGGMASGMLMKDGKYSDERFIDAMAPHHEGAVEMAEVATKNAEHEEIKRLSEDIVSAQEAEITQLKSIKQEEFGTSEIPMDMSMQEMKGMGMMTDPQELADKKPFDKAFIDNMIPHHKSAIEMAEVASGKTKNPEIKNLANNIVESQKREISQMTHWREEWYPEG